VTFRTGGKKRGERGLPAHGQEQCKNFFDLEGEEREYNEPANQRNDQEGEDCLICSTCDELGHKKKKKKKKKQKKKKKKKKKTHQNTSLFRSGGR